MPEELIQKAKASPNDLDDADLAAAFVHLMEFPVEALQSPDLLSHLGRREGSYEISRASALYYANLQGDLFDIGERPEFAASHLRAVRHIAKALALRDDSHDVKLKEFVAHGDSSAERDLAFAMRALVKQADDIATNIATESGHAEALLKRAKVFKELGKQVSDMDNPLDVLGSLRPHWDAYADFVRRTL